MFCYYLQSLLGVTKDDGKKKPATLKFYNFSKGGTDIVDQRIGNYSVSAMSRRWSMAAFSYILDTARVNSQTLYAINSGKQPRKLNSYEYDMELVMQLVTPHIITRRNTTPSLQSRIKLAMNVILPPQANPEATNNQLFSPNSPARQRCKLCIESGKPHSNISATTTRCQECGTYTCRKEHTIYICSSCYEKT